MSISIRSRRSRRSPTCCSSSRDSGRSRHAPALARGRADVSPAPCGAPSARHAVRQAPGDQHDERSSAPARASTTSQADITHRTAVFRGLTGFNGTGVKIGVLSDGVEHLAARRPRAISARSRCSRGRPAPATKARRCSSSFTTSRPARSCTSRPRSRRSPRSRRTSATCAPPAATSSWTTSAISWRRRSRTARARRVVSPTNGGVVTQAVKDVTALGAHVFLVGRQLGQSERRHVRRVGRGLHPRRRDGQSARRPAPATFTASPAPRTSTP